MVVINGGPGVTNNISPPNVVSVGNSSGILTLTPPAPATLFGYGYALLSSTPVTNATTITLFSGATNVGVFLTTQRPIQVSPAASQASKALSRSTGFRSP